MTVTERAYTSPIWYTPNEPAAPVQGCAPETFRAIVPVEDERRAGSDLTCDRRRVRFLAVLGALLLLAACAPRNDAPRTYGEHVAPILARRCARCHGGPGRAAVVPPRLASYEDAKWSASAIALAVQRGRMPPWGPDNTGLCGTWSDALWLSEGEINTVSEWAESGAPQGPAPRTSPPGDPVELPPPGSRWIAAGPLQFEPGLGSATARCFVVPLDLAEDVRVTALRVAGSGAVSVQRAALYALDGEEAERAAARRDAEAPSPGWPCYGGSGVAEARLVAGWSWLSPVVRMPEGTGIRLAAGRPVVIQLHYSLVAAGLGASVRASAEIAVSTSAREAELVPLRAERLRLPPGQRQAEASAELVVSQRLAVAGVLPRMHTLGRVLDLVRPRGEERTCVAHFGHWDPQYQQLFVRERAVELEPGDRLQLSCTYDSTSRTMWVEEGEEIEREECAAFLYLLPRR